MSKPAFSLPQRKVQEWVDGAGEGARPPKGKSARLTIDLDADLHARFKAACALSGTDMVSEVRQFIGGWTQKNS